MLIMLKSRGSICLTNTKGLLNAPGQNNCFLNSAVQVLWHLDIFRRSFRELSGHACMGRSCIFCALKELFAQLQYSDESALPPDALRRALAETFYDQQRFQLGLMDDAAECFENILMRIHFHISNNESEDTCHAKHCIPHQKFTMTLVEQSICHVCGGTSEPLPFSQMVHYVSTSALCCQAKQLLKDANIQTIRFGQLLRKAGSMGDIRDCPSHCGERIQIRRTLTNKPEIVSLGLVWDSDHSDIEHIMDVMKTIGTSLSLSDVFHLPADHHLISSSVLHLVGVVTYYGKHYSTFFFHTKLRIWIYFDDATVREVGSRWEQVVDKCRKGHYQPLLLLYADPDGGPVPVETAPRLVTMAPGHKLSQPEIRGKDANFHSPLAIGKTHENEIMISENSRNSVNIRRAITPNFDSSRNVISPVMQRRAITPNPNKATYEDYDYLPPKDYSDTNNKNTRNLYHQTLAGNNNYANLMYLDPQQLKHLYHHTDNVPKTALPNPGYQNKSPPSTPNYCIMSPSASPTRTRKAKVVSPALDSYGYVSSNNIDCRRPVPSPVTNSEVRTNLKPLSFTKANELLMKKESLKQQKSKEKMPADGRFQVGLKRDTLQPALSSSGSSHHSLQDITNPADCSNNVDKQFKSLEDLMNSLELKASQEYAQMHSLQNGPVEGSVIPSKEKVNLIDMTNHKILSKVPPNQIHKQYSYEDSDNYIDREKVKSILNLQKLQRQRSFNSQCSSTTSGNRSSNSSLDSFETAVRNAKIIPLTANGKDKTRYDVFNPAIFAHKYNVGDRNSASSSSSTSMENANYEHLPPRQRYQIIPGKKPTPGYTSQGSKEDTGYSSCDSASISSSNSLSLPNAPLDYTSASYKRLAQIPENIQTGLKPAAPLSGSSGDSVLNYGDRDLKHPFIVQTKAQNHTGYSEIEATDECERLCLEADELIALSRMKEEEKDLPTALTLCNNAAAQARSAMEVSEASAESLIFARMKYNCCVMRAQSLHRRILLRQQDNPPDTQDSKRKEIAETANGQQGKIRIGNPQNSSAEIPWDLLSKHVSNIEAYATLPRRRLPSGKKGSKRSSKKERDYELYQSFLERQKAYNATTTPEALKKSANIERETEKISKDVRHRKPLKEEVVRILKARHAEKEAEVIATKGPPPEYKKKDSEKITDEQIIRPIAGPSERKIQNNAKAHKKEHKIVRKLKGTLLSSKNRSLPDLRQSADSSSDFDPISYSDHRNLRRAMSPVECLYTGYTSDVEGDLSSVHLRQKTIYNDSYSLKKPNSPPLISNDAIDDYRNCSRSKILANSMPLPEQDLAGNKQETKSKVFSGSWLQELQVKQSEIKTRLKQQVMQADNLHLPLPADYQFPGYGNQTGNELDESRLRVKDLASQFELMSQKNPLSPESAKYNTLPRKKDVEVDEKFLGKFIKSPKNVTFSDQVELVASADEMAYTQQPHLPAQKIVTQNAVHQLRLNCKTIESQKSPRESRDISFPPPDNRDNYTTNVNYCVKKVPCHLCRKKHVLPPALYCTDCNFYMSRFKPKT